MANSSTLIYVHDPMCSWCWGFRPTLKRLRSQLPEDVGFTSLLGGLAADSDQIMPLEMQKSIEMIWHRIAEKIPDTQFNYNFWRNNKPRRSTYPACRAVLSAKALNASSEDSMVKAIQEAYYLHALNPSDEEILIRLADEIGLQSSAFGDMLNSTEINQQLQREIEHARNIGAHSFPSLILKKNDNSYWPIDVNYTDVQAMLNIIEKISA